MARTALAGCLQGIERVIFYIRLYTGLDYATSPTRFPGKMGLPYKVSISQPLGAALRRSINLFQAS